jgi:hypothetical protein
MQMPTAVLFAYLPLDWVWIGSGLLVNSCPVFKATL